MSPEMELPSPSRLWKTLSPERKLAAATAFWEDDGAVVEQAEAVAVIAQRIKFRTKSVIGMPADRKARHLATLAGPSEAVAARLLVSYHLAAQRPLMGRFLDLLGIAHDNGLIEEDEVTTPEAGTLRAAAKALAGEFPAADVSLYFSTLLWQDADTWGELLDVPERVALTSA